jgi:hypothetical protein
MNSLSSRARIGFWLAVLLGVVDVISAFIPPPSDGAGPPLVIMILAGVLGLITLGAAVVLARSGRSRLWITVIVVSRILSGLTALPAFFVAGVPTAFVIWAAATVVLTIVAVVLLLHRSAPVAAEQTPVAG